MAVHLILADETVEADCFPELHGSDPLRQETVWAYTIAQRP